MSTDPEVPAGDGLLDAALIRRTCHQAMWAAPPASEEAFADLVERLSAYTELLLADVSARAPQMRGEWGNTAEHVIPRARQALDAVASVTATVDQVQEVATRCRALLTLHERPAPHPTDATRSHGTP